MKNNSANVLSSQELASFCSQISSVLKAGISPSEGIAIMLEDTSAEEERQILTAIQETLNTTGVFSLGLEDAKVFPEYMMNMVQLGEQAGRLDDVMEALALHYERESGLAAAIKSAVTYPCIMIGMMVLVVLVLITKVLPVFDQVFRQLGQNMSGFSKSLLLLGNSLNRYSAVFLAALVILGGLCFSFAKTDTGRKSAAKLFSRLRFTRGFSHKSAACRFASGMALVLKSGLTPEEGLTMAAKLTGNPAFQEKVAACCKLMENGSPLTESLSKSGIFTGMQARLLLIGDKTGSLDDAMDRIASHYQDDLDESIQNAISVIEPTLVAILSILVGLILLSVMMPLLGILSGI